jgi:magnesium-transporting ATPase (P-type)
MSDQALEHIIPNLRVISRATPADKSRLVRAAQKCGYVVGMTGDGANDSSALFNADVGFALGSGAEVAKEASDIVILDDNISSIIQSILYGRTIFKSIRKFIVFQSTVNLASTVIVFLGPFLGFDFPLTLTQLLWVNLVMDTLAAIAYGGEHARRSYMREAPTEREASIISKTMWSSILWSGLYISIVSLIFLRYSAIEKLFVREGSSAEFSYNVFLTAFFCLFIFITNFNSFNVRTDRINLAKGIMRNRNFLLVVGLIFIIQISFTYIGGNFLRTEGLLLKEWLIIIGIAFTIIPIDVIRKKFIVPRIKMNEHF